MLNLVLLVLLFSRFAFSLNTTESYSRNLTLVDDPPNRLVLFWKHDNKTITFEIHALSVAWIAFGINNNSYSDVVVAWLNVDGTGHFSDRTLNSQNYLSVDQEQKWLPIDMFKTEDITVFKFSRSIKVNCNKSQDLDITLGDNRVAYAYGNFMSNIDYLNETIPSPLLLAIKYVNLLNESLGPFNCPLVATLPSFNSTPTENYSNFVDLVENGKYRLYWNFNTTYFIGEIHVRTNGWVGFGLSPDGRMNQSDAIVGWINSSGTVNFTDRHLTEARALIDTQQDWQLIYAAEKNGYNIFKFVRLILLCNSEDRPIEQGTPYVVFAWGDDDPSLYTYNDVFYHNSNRGVKQVNLISNPNSFFQSTISSSQTLEFSISNAILPKSDRYYFCKTFQTPSNLTEKQHIYQYEIVLPSSTSTTVYSVQVYECGINVNSGYPIVYRPGDCTGLEVCTSVGLGWAQGGQLINYLPTDSGYPIGRGTDYKYFVIEVLYDKSTDVLGFIDKLTLKYTITNQLRSRELGILAVGSKPDLTGIAIPPGSVGNFTNMTFVASRPHTNSAGVSVWTKVIRDSVDMGYLTPNKYYGSTYQQLLLLTSTIYLTKIDQLVTQCVYNTRDRSSFTLGGKAKTRELCLNMLMYFPRSEYFKSCLSTPYSVDYVNLLVQLAGSGEVNRSATFLTNISNPLEYQRVIATSLKSINVTDNVRIKFRELYNTTRIIEYCNQDSIDGPYDQIKCVLNYSDLNVCPASVQNDTGLPSTTPSPTTNTTKCTIVIASGNVRVEPMLKNVLTVLTFLIVFRIK